MAWFDENNGICIASDIYWNFERVRSGMDSNVYAFLHYGIQFSAYLNAITFESISECIRLKFQYITLKSYKQIKFTTFELNDEIIAKYELHTRSTYNVGIHKLGSYPNRKIFDNGISYNDWLKKENIKDENMCDHEHDDDMDCENMHDYEHDGINCDDATTENVASNSKKFKHMKRVFIYLISQINQMKEGPVNYWVDHQSVTQHKMVKLVTKSGKVYWLPEKVLKNAVAAIALEQQSNWFYRKNDYEIEILSQKFQYTELHETILTTFFGQAVCGDNIVRVNDNNNNT